MKAWLFLAAMVGLEACSQVPASPYAGPNQPRVVPNAQSVTVVNVRSEAEGTPWAEGYCAKQGRTAHFIDMEAYRVHHKATDSASFDCVQRSS
jgi:putative hemolysin